MQQNMCIKKGINECFGDAFKGNELIYIWESGKKGKDNAIKFYNQL